MVVGVVVVVMLMVIFRAVVFFVGGIGVAGGVRVGINICRKKCIAGMILLEGRNIRRHVARRRSSTGGLLKRRC
jgi:hypothetical protein